MKSVYCAVRTGSSNKSLRVVFERLINTRYVISRRRLPSALFVTVSFSVVENPCRYGEATDVMHCVENYVTGKLTSGSGISLHTEKDNFFLRNLFEIFFLQPTSCPFVIMSSGGWIPASWTDIPLRP